MHWQKDQFGIGRLPQQEVRQPLLARRADQQIGIGNAGGAEPRASAAWSRRRRVERPAADVQRQFARRLDDFLPRRHS